MKNNIIEIADFKTGEVKKKIEPPHYLGHRGRLRARLMASAPGSLPDYELLELLLFTSIPRGDTKPLAKRLINEFGSLAQIINTTPEKLKKVQGVGDATVANLRMASEFVNAVLKSEMKGKTVLNNWMSLLNYCRASMGHLKKEIFKIIFLDNKYGIIADEIQGKGTVNHTPVYIREVVSRCLELDASFVILSHNHPSGDITPSRADINITNEIIKALKTVDIKVVDHLIIGANDHYSFKSNELI